MDLKVNSLKSETSCTDLVSSVLFAYVFVALNLSADRVQPCISFICLFDFIVAVTFLFVADVVLYI